MNRLVLLTVGAITVACRAEETDGPGRIAVSWTGADTGHLSIPARARWCANDSVIEISGAVGDTGVALALLTRDSAVAPGEFPVGMPLPERTRPSARVALRWVGDMVTEGYYGLRGTVTIDSGPGLSGSLQATLRSVNNAAELSLNGTLTRVSIQSGSAASCGEPADSADTSVD